MTKNSIIIAAAIVVAMLSAVSALAADYNYVRQEVFRSWLTSGKQMIVVDIQEPPAFRRQHFRGALATGAFPVSTDADRRKLDPVISTIRSSSSDVVIVCPRGGGGAKKTHDYLVEKGIVPSRLFILEKGMEGWPYPEVTVKEAASR